MALDVYFAERSRTKLLEMRRSLANFYTILLAGSFVKLFFDDILCAVRLKEFTAYFIVVEAELISQEA